MNEQKLKQAIDNCNLVRIRVDSNEKGIIDRKCVPFDIGPSKKYKDGRIRYHFYDLESPSGANHNLSILPEQLMGIEILEEHFEPQKYVTWETAWFYKRNWGKWS